MKGLNKFLFGLYYFIWAITLGLGFAYLSSNFYTIGRLFGPLFAILALIISVLTLLILGVLYFSRPNKKPLNWRYIKLSVYPFFGIIPLILLYLMPRKMEDNFCKIRVTYVTYMCECAKWRITDIRPDHSEAYSEDIFLEPLSDNISFPDTIGYDGDILELKGKFYTKKGFPKDYDPGEEQPDKASVFQYTQYRVIKSNYSDSVKDSLIINRVRL